MNKKANPKRNSVHQSPIKKDEGISQDLKSNAKMTNLVIYRLMTILALDIIAISILFTIHKDAANTNVFVFQILPILNIVFPILSVGGLIYVIVAKSKSVNVEKHTITPNLIFGSTLVATIVCLMYKQITSTRLIVGIIAVSALYFVYYLYPRIFYKYSVFTFACVTISSAYNISRISDVMRILEVVARIGGMLVAIIGIILVVPVLFGKKSLTIGRFTVFDAESKLDCYSVLVSASITLIGAAVAFFTASLSIYVTLLLCASFLVIAIVYTIKMI